ncbi:unnamed protein product, partial [Mesorhabditis spiculigera]
MEKNEDYAKLEYWDRRFEQEKCYEWLCDFDAFSQLVLKRLKQLKPNPRILHVGCGSSQLSMRLYDAGFHDITNVDFSEVLISSSKARYGEGYPEMRWICDDMTSLCRLPSKSYDVVLEKATIEALLVGEKSPWSPSDSALKMVDDVFSSINRVLTSSGLFLSISFTQPHFRVPALLRRSDWGVEVEEMDRDTDAAVREKYGRLAVNAEKRGRSPPTPPGLMSFKLGDRVITENNGKGVIAFIGTTQFAEGEWNGLILDEPRGKNNGSVQDVAYFECEPGYGLFVPTKKLRLEKPATSTTPARPQTRSQASKLRAPTSKLTTPASTPGISPAESVEQLKVSPPQQPTTSAPPPKKEAPSGLKQPSSVTPAPIDIKKPADVVEAAPASPSVKERAQKIMEEPAPTTQNCQVVVEEPPHEKRPSLPPPPTLPPGISEGTEVDILRYENKDLKEKMETLRMRRQDDREKLKELDKVKMQLQVQLDSRQRMMEQLQQALAKLAEKERSSKKLN